MKSISYKRDIILTLKKGLSIILGIFLGVTTHTAAQNKGCAAEFTFPASTSLNLNTAALNMPGTLTVASSGTLQVSTGTITVSNNGNWSNSGTFTSGSSVVQFTETSHTISGSSTFYNLNCEISGGAINFEANKRQTISNILTLKGASGSYLSLRSSSTGTQWELYPQGTIDINYVDVKDCSNVGSTRINPSSWTDSGNNSNWGTAPSDGGGGDGGGGGGGGGGTVLTVNSTNPSSGATNVDVNISISATFSEIMDGASLNTDTFKVNGGGNQVAGTVTTNGATATFTPSSNLANNTTYTVTITQGVKAANAAGTTLSANYSWSFTTIQGGGGGGTPTPTQTATATPSPVQTPTQTPTPIITLTPTPVPTPTATSQPTPTPTVTPTPTPASSLNLSKETAYLSGDTIVATVLDADKNTNSTTADILTTALKVREVNSIVSTDLLLDLNEDGINSGTFLATIRTGTTTAGGASSGVRANSGTIKATQGGTATVVYNDTTPLEKVVKFSSFDATIAFNANTYPLGSYAEITLADAERNTGYTEVESLLNDVAIETSSLNSTKVKTIETGADTGTFMGSIQVAASGGTLEFERIQATVGDLLTITYIDEITTTGFSRLVTDTASVTTPAIPTPTPTSTPVCVATSIEANPAELEIPKKESAAVTVTVTGEGGCPVVGQTVKAKVSSSGKEHIKMEQKELTTNTDGQATFTITARKETGKAKVKFKTDSLKTEVKVKVTK